MRAPAAAIAQQECAAAATPAMDEEAFRLFYNRTASPLHAYLCATLHDRSLADDLLQETFLRFLQAEISADENHCKNYLFRIATNLMRDHFRSAKNEINRAQRAPLALCATSALSDPPSGQRLDDDVNRREDLRRIMKELNPKQRELLWLAYVEQFSHGEIASMVGAKTESIRPMLARARQALTGLLRGRMGASR